MGCAELSAGLAISSQRLCAVFCQDWVSGGVTYRGMDATDLDSSGNSQDHSVRTTVMASLSSGGPESPFDNGSPRPGLLVKS